MPSRRLRAVWSGVFSSFNAGFELKGKPNASCAEVVKLRAGPVPKAASAVEMAEEEPGRSVHAGDEVRHGHPGACCRMYGRGPPASVHRIPVVSLVSCLQYVGLRCCIDRMTAT